ncbi:MAG: hypothetical protein PUP93_15995 [Rhizonema sp. NSF051]|nr:hypothetical protein [Rhizonema sp. NSF051]
MSKSFLPADDLPPTETTQLDQILRFQLERSTGRYFYEACDRITQSLLSSCQWYLMTDNSTLKLVIDCPDIVTYWHIVSNITQISYRLERFVSDAKIRVYPPFGKGIPFEISVEEVSAYQDWL